MPGPKKLNKIDISQAGGKLTPGQKPRFSSLIGVEAVNNTPDPLRRVEYTGDIERDTAAEFEALQDDFFVQKKQRRDAYREQIDTSFWCALVFQSAKQKNEFFECLGWDDCEDAQYINGLVAAERLGVSLTIVPIESKPSPSAPKKLRPVKKIGGKQS